MVKYVTFNHHYTGSNPVGLRDPISFNFQSHIWIKKLSAF